MSKLEVFISSRTKQGEGRLGGESKMLMLKELLLALRIALSSKSACDCLFQSTKLLQRPIVHVFSLLAVAGDANAIAVISKRLLRLLYNSPSPSSSSSPSPSLPLLLSQSLFVITEVGSRVVRTRTMKQCLKRNLAQTILKSVLTAL